VIKDKKPYDGPALEHPDKPRMREVWTRDQTWCIKVAAEVDGKCVKLPDEPDIGSPDRAARVKVWCAEGAIPHLASQACDPSLAGAWPD